MKGGRAPPPHHNRISSTSSSRRSTTSNSADRLAALGFEEGELEMFLDTFDISTNTLIDTYLEIAQNPPYNLNWGTERTAAAANYDIGVFKRNGVEYTKHDIVEDTLNYYYDQNQDVAQGVHKKRRKIRTRHRTKKLRKSKRKTMRRRKY